MLPEYNWSSSLSWKKQGVSSGLLGCLASGFLRFTLHMWVSGVKNLGSVIPPLDRMFNQETSMNDERLAVEQGTPSESSQTVNVLCMQCAGDLSILGPLKRQTAES